MTDEKYSLRKNIIKKILGISLKIDDSIKGLREEILVLVIRVLILFIVLGVLIYAIIARNYIQIALFSFIFLSSILSYLGQIKRYKMTLALNQLKKMRLKNEI